jgi:hypothetical protein
MALPEHHRCMMQVIDGVTIRRLEDSDAMSVRRLAQLDSADLPAGALLGAEVDGRLVAATPLAGGETIADPFRHTAEIRALLELRAGQMRKAEPQVRVAVLRPAPTAPS